MTSGSVAVFAKTRHLRACSRKSSGSLINIPIQVINLPLHTEHRTIFAGSAPNTPSQTKAKRDQCDRRTCSLSVNLFRGLASALARDPRALGPILPRRGEPPSLSGIGGVGRGTRGRAGRQRALARLIESPPPAAGQLAANRKRRVFRSFPASTGAKALPIGLTAQHR